MTKRASSTEHDALKAADSVDELQVPVKKLKADRESVTRVEEHADSGLGNSPAKQAAAPAISSSPTRKAKKGSKGSAASCAEDEGSAAKAATTSGTTGTVPIHRGRFKRRFLAKHALLLRRADPARGLLVSCPTAAETRALGQVQAFLSRVAMELVEDLHPVYPELQQPDDVDLAYVEDADDAKPPGHDGSVGPSVGNQGNSPYIGQESAVGPTKRQRSMFPMFDSGCSGLLFVRFRNNAEPLDFVMRLFEYAKALPNAAAAIEKQLGHCHRFLPIQHVATAATITDIVEGFAPTLHAVDQFAQKCVKTSDDAGINSEQAAPSVAIVVEARNAPAIARKPLTLALAAKLPQALRVDLKNPDVVVVVTVFKAVAGMAIVRGSDWRATRRFNLLQSLRQGHA